MPAQRSHQSRIRRRRRDSFDNYSNHNKQFRFQSLIFIPYFVFYLFSSTILQFFFRGGRSAWWSILALYTLSRLIIGFYLVLLFRFSRFVLAQFLILCDCLFQIRSQKESDLLHEYQKSASYQNYIDIGQKLDNVSHRITKWKRTPTSDDYDYELLQLQLSAMKQKRKKNNVSQSIQAISHVFRRTFCSLHNANLYHHSYVGTKHIIEEYYDELCENVRFIANVRRLHNHHNHHTHNNTLKKHTSASANVDADADADADAIDGRLPPTQLSLPLPLPLPAHSPALSDSLSATSMSSSSSVSLSSMSNNNNDSQVDGHASPPTHRRTPINDDTVHRKLKNSNRNRNTTANNVTFVERIEFFFRCKRSLGRTALCLSGGGALSMVHVGVIRTLIQNDCLPLVISGTSGGAILAGYLAVVPDRELQTNLDKYFGYRVPNQFGSRFLPSFPEQLFGAYRSRLLIPNADFFVHAMKNYVGEYTFHEAFLLTRRHVSISVSYSTKNRDNKSHAHYILLNHITSPDVYIWSAITASCALPGLMKPQQLYSKRKDESSGQATKVPYYPDGVQWVDGSLQADIPSQTLQEMFRVNYIIVSQVNPHVTPFIQEATSFRTTQMGYNSSSNFGLTVLEMLDDLAYATVNHQLNRLVKLKAIPAVYGHNFDKFATQNFTGDITIVPRIPLNLRFKILSQPTDSDMRQYIKIGEHATWPHLQHIQQILRVEKLIDAIIVELKQYQSQSCILVNNLSPRGFRMNMNMSMRMMNMNPTTNENSDDSDCEHDMSGMQPFIIQHDGTRPEHQAEGELGIRETTHNLDI